MFRAYSDQGGTLEESGQNEDSLESLLITTIIMVKNVGGGYAIKDEEADQVVCFVSWDKARKAVMLDQLHDRYF